MQSQLPWREISFLDMHLRYRCPWITELPNFNKIFISLKQFFETFKLGYVCLQRHQQCSLAASERRRPGSISQICALGKR
jgi:hypothetical protein